MTSAHGTRQKLQIWRHSTTRDHSSTSYNMSTNHSTQKLSVVVSGFLAQVVTFYFHLGLVSGIFAFVTSCGAFMAIQSSGREGSSNRRFGQRG